MAKVCNSHTGCLPWKLEIEEKSLLFHYLSCVI